MSVRHRMTEAGLAGNRWQRLTRSTTEPAKKSDQSHASVMFRESRGFLVPSMVDIGHQPLVDLRRCFAAYAVTDVRWLSRPAIALNTRRPIDLLNSPEGGKVVTMLLLRMEGGANGMAKCMNTGSESAMKCSKRANLWFYPRETFTTLCLYWACLDSNQGPRDYESPALTAVLQARRKGGELYCADSRRPPENIRGRAHTADVKMSWSQHRVSPTLPPSRSPCGASEWMCG